MQCLKDDHFSLSPYLDMVLYEGRRKYSQNMCIDCSPTVTIHFVTHVVFRFACTRTDGEKCILIQRSEFIKPPCPYRSAVSLCVGKKGRGFSARRPAFDMSSLLHFHFACLPCFVIRRRKQRQRASREAAIDQSGGCTMS